MDILYIEKKDFPAFLKKISKERSLYLPKQTEKGYSFVKFEGDFFFNPVRTNEPLKAFLFLTREKVASFSKTQVLPQEKIIIFGLKSCDLYSLKVQDYVFKEGETSDPFYSCRRENMTIISSDCTQFLDVCFCLIFDILPYPTNNFDLNLSALNSGFIVDVGSERGEELIKENEIFFKRATERQLAVRKAKREELVGKLSQNIKSQKIPPKDALKSLVRKNFESEVWAEEAQKCVECGACNFVCSTCHCFLLSDRKFKDEFERLRCWDSCQYPNFARVAAGANPLKTRPQRLRNRFIKKFEFFPENLGLYACCGCGRCIEACPGKIDIREILKKLTQISADKIAD